MYMHVFRRQRLHIYIYRLVYTQRYRAENSKTSYFCSVKTEALIIYGTITGISRSFCLHFHRFLAGDLNVLTIVTKRESFT